MKLIKPRRRLTLATQSLRSIDEQISQIINALGHEIRDLDDPDIRDEWMAVLEALANGGDTSALERATRYRRKVVSLDEFLFGDAYLGVREQDIYPGVLEALHDIDCDRYDEVICKGGLGIGKTFLSNLSMARDLYKLSCMRNPHDTYGIAQSTPIVFTIQSIRLSTAKKVVFEELGRFVKNSPYFQQYFPYNPLIKSDMIFPEFNIRIMPVSSASGGVISMNVIGGQLDELNFMQKTLKSKSSEADAQGSFDQAKTLYNTLASRRKSRFTHRDGLPGALYLISSSRFPDDFTEIKAAQAEMLGGTDSSMYVFQGSNWGVKGREKFSPEEFTVQLGNATFPSKVLKDGEAPDRDCHTIQVPMDYYQDFMRDVDGSIRDHAGLTTTSTHPFFTRREKISESMDLAKEHGYLNPMSLEEAELSIGLPDLDARKVRNDVRNFRVAHIDLGHTRDACGLAVGHIAGYKVKEFRNEETGKVEHEVLPVIAYDVILRIVQPLGGEIEFENIRRFLRKLNSRYKLGIEYVTTDGFQSTDLKQILSKQGFKTGYTSVEKIEPWRTFRDALYDGRVLMCGHNFVKKELSEVEITVNNSNKEKVDHRPNGTKDVADAVVGVAAFLFRRRVAWHQVRLAGGRTGLFLLGGKTKGKGSDENVLPGAERTRKTPLRRPRPSTQRRSLIRR